MDYFFRFPTFRDKTWFNSFNLVTSFLFLVKRRVLLLWVKKSTYMDDNSHSIHHFPMHLIYFISDNNCSIKAFRCIFSTTCRSRSWPSVGQKYSIVWDIVTKICCHTQSNVLAQWTFSIFHGVRKPREIFNNLLNNFNSESGRRNEALFFEAKYYCCWMNGNWFVLTKRNNCIWVTKSTDFNLKLLQSATFIKYWFQMPLLIHTEGWRGG